TLVLLARFRFPETPPARALPREQPLERLAAEALFDELATSVNRARTRLAPFTPVLELDPAPVSPANPTAHRSWVPALRFRDDLAVAAIARPVPLRVLTADGAEDAALVAHDPIRGIAVVRLAEADPLPSTFPVEAPQSRSAPAGYAVAVDGAPGGPTFRPVFLDRLDPLRRPLWPSARVLPASLRPGEPGTIVANLEGRVIGMVVGSHEAVLVPASELVRVVERLLTTKASRTATLGAELQDLDPQLADLSGALHGALVTFVDPEGPASGVLQVGDVVETFQGEPVFGVGDVLEWIRAAESGTTVLLDVRRGGEARSLQVTLAPSAGAGAGTVAPPRAGEAAGELGLTLEFEAWAGSHVRAVAPGSAARRAGFVPGDLITWMAGEDRPTPAQVRRLFANAPPDARLMVSVARGGRHRVLLLEKR
ncbi:MAG TPA: PDZ domain-containing protein, partial [Vicinamibacterales bacterium]|nr:PDZ domain-containing protein [Vicinamibacterales bacterium]